jgi:hypothetical protein
MSSHVFVTSDFFVPLFDALEANPKSNPVELSQALDLRDVSLVAMNAARKEHRLGLIPKISFRDFQEGRAYNKFAVAGPQDCMDAELEVLPCFLKQPILHRVEDFLTKHPTRSGHIDTDLVSRNIDQLAQALNEFLNNPKIYTRKKDMPKHSGFIDRLYFEEKGDLREYLVRFNGWTPTLFERFGSGKWTLVPAS